MDLGTIIGRVAGRNKDAKVVFNSTTYYLDKKTTKIKHTLHDGFKSITLQKFTFELIGTNKVKFKTPQKICY